MKSTLILEDIRIYAYHGVLPEENVIGTFYLVNLEVEADLWKAAGSDLLEDSISYADINEVVREEMKVNSKLLEHVCGRIIARIQAKYPQVSALKIRLTKENPPMHGECKGASVQFELKY